MAARGARATERQGPPDRLPGSTAFLEANLLGPFREGLRELGYQEGRNLAIEFRWAEGKYERFPPSSPS
jgi:hypothetical protein